MIKGYLWGHEWEHTLGTSMGTIHFGKNKTAKFGTWGGGGHKGYLRNYYVGLAYQGKDTMFRFIIEYI
jgi:hypothetical protein